MGPIELILAGFDGFDTAEKAVGELRAMDRNDELSVLNLAVLKKDAGGRVTSSDDGDVKPGSGALFGALVGAIIGFLGGPAGAVVGAAAGAITGGITAAGVDFGFSRETVEALQQHLTPNSSAILALVEQEESPRLVEQINARRGRVIHTTLREDLARGFRKDWNKE